MAKLFLDMDGVLADFDSTAREILGMDSYRFEFIHGTDEFWKRLNAVPDLFNTFKPMPDAWHLWTTVKHLEPAVLTAIPKKDAHDVVAQKTAWIDRYLGRDVDVITCVTKDKPKYCEHGDVLIDDRTVNRDVWQKAGGWFIHHSSAEQSIRELKAIGMLP